MTEDVDKSMRYYRQQFVDDDPPGPRSADYEGYAEYIVSFFQARFDAYTHFNYALEDLYQYIATEKALDRLANDLINGKETFVFVGGAFLPGSSAAKGYRRTAVLGVFKKLERHPNCTVFGVNEFKTTKLCSFCFRKLQQPHKRGHIQKKYRYLCRQCILW